MFDKEFWQYISAFIACVALALVGLYFAVCALMAGDYREVEQVGNNCVLVTEYTHVWYHHQNEITNQYTQCGEHVFESD